MLKGLFNFFAVVAVLGAVGTLIWASMTVFGADLTKASAIQVTQIYTEGVFWLLATLIGLGFAGISLLVARQMGD